MNQQREDWEPLRRLDLTSLASDPRVVYVIDDRLRIRWRNQPLPGWDIGRSILDAIQGPQRYFYEALFLRMLTSATAHEHEYECPTPELYRRFRLRMEPTDGDGLLLVHTLVEERPNTTPPSGDRVETYLEGGRVVMCGHCRRVRRPGTDRWDWVPALLESPPRSVAHMLCPECHARHFRAS